MWRKTLAKLLSLLLVGAVAFVVLIFRLHGCMTEHTRVFGTQDITFSFAPEGDRIVFNAMGNGGRDLFLLDLKRLLVKRLTNTKDYETCPAFSPDGRSIVYSAGRPGDRADHLFLRKLDTNQVQQLTSEDANDCSPTFSPDGSHIVFTRDTHYNWGGLATSWSGGGSVWSIHRDGSGLKRVLPSTTFAISPHLSSDGRTLLWWDTQGVWVAPVDGDGAPRLIAEGGRDAVFSSDGEKIAFTRGEYSPDLRIYLIPAKGGHATLLTQTISGCNNPQFSPHGTEAYFFVADSFHESPSYSLWCIEINGSHLREIAGSNLIYTPMSQDLFKVESRGSAGDRSMSR